MHILDGELCRYHHGEYDARNWSVPLIAIGWLESPFPFARGAVPPPFAVRLKYLVEQSAWVLGTFLGMMECSLCLAEKLPSPGPVWSQENLFVPGAGAVYVAPGGIVHYVENHNYQPPSEFIEAVLRSPEPQFPEFWRALRKANDGVEPPLRRAPELFAQCVECCRVGYRADGPEWLARTASEFEPIALDDRGACEACQRALK